MAPPRSKASASSRAGFRVALLAAWMSAFGCKAILDADGFEVEPTPPCGQGLAPPWALVEACLWYTGCFVDAPKMALSYCIASDPYLSSNTKVSGAGFDGCPKVLEPLGLGFLDGGCPVQSPCADANRAVHCKSGLPGGGWYEDCTKRGGECHAGEVVGCRLDAGLSCADATAYVCDETRKLLYRCTDAGVPVGVNCAAINTACEGKDNASDCYYQPAFGCQPGEGPSCVGDTARTCIGSVAYESHCGAAGLPCVVARDRLGAAVPVCVAPGCGIQDVNACKESCSTDGKVARLCLGGAQYAVNCAVKPEFGCREYAMQEGGSVVTRAMCTY